MQYETFYKLFPRPFFFFFPEVACFYMQQQVVFNQKGLGKKNAKKKEK